MASGLGKSHSRRWLAAAGAVALAATAIAVAADDPSEDLRVRTAAVVAPPPETIAVLDYDVAVANDGEDIAEHLRVSGRHRGKINVLDAQGRVQTLLPTQLDPLVVPKAWTP